MGFCASWNDEMSLLLKSCATLLVSCAAAQSGVVSASWKIRLLRRLLLPKETQHDQGQTAENGKLDIPVGSGFIFTSYSYNGFFGIRTGKKLVRSLMACPTVPKSGRRGKSVSPSWSERSESTSWSSELFPSLWSTFAGAPGAKILNHRQSKFM